MSEFEDKTQNFSDLMKKAVEEQRENQTEIQPENQTEELLLEENKELEMKPMTGMQEDASSEISWSTEPVKEVETYQPVSEVGVISSATKITGTVSSKGHVRIEGDVVGDIFAFGDIKVNGKVIGDLEGGNIELEGCSIAGDIRARGDVAVGKESKITGDVNGELITIDGKIEGNIEAQKGAHMSSTSMVKGSIAALTLSMSSGAELQGKVDVSKDDK